MVDRRCYIGSRCRKLESITINPGDRLAFCDLQNCSFDHRDLSEVSFIGCHLSQTTFVKAELRNSRFLGCFVSPLYPMRLEGATTEGISIIESFLKSTPSLEANQYTNERIDLLNGLISKCNDERYECINKLGDLNEPSLSLILACSLFDTEWEVRAITLRTLGKLRWTHGHFPYEDRLILEAICLCLGDENPIVRQTASDWVKQFGVPDEILFRCLRGITSSVLSEKLAALRVATTIAKLANNYSSVLESTDFSLLLQDSTEEVRILCVRLFGLLDNSESLTNISCALSDTSSLVKLEALYAVCALSESVPRETMSHLLNDPDEAIRLQVLNTLEELGELERTDVIQKMSDSSEKIRSAARKLIKTFDD